MKRAKSLHITDTQFHSCTFLGRYYDTRFGMTNSIRFHPEYEGGLSDCEFSGAELHLCSFHNCDPATLKFPGWPHVTVLHPRRNADDWLAIPFPQSFRPLQRTVAGQQTATAFVLHWPTFAKKAKDGTDPEAIRRLLAGKDYILV